MRGATTIKRRKPVIIFISTHTPLARRDYQPVAYGVSDSNFYSHASCEARLIQTLLICVFVTFLLTRLLRGATLVCNVLSTLAVFLLTRLLRGATNPRFVCPFVAFNFYSHASCEARLSFHLKHLHGHQFLLTRLLRGATLRQWKLQQRNLISTHTPLARRDDT